VAQTHGRHKSKKFQRHANPYRKQKVLNSLINAMACGGDPVFIENRTSTSVRAGEAKK
jgi:hypothetical protein